MNEPIPKDGNEGQAIVEFAIAFPLQLMIMLAIMQLALLYVGKQVITYASYSAARAAMVGDSPQDAEDRARHAAVMICSPITGQTIKSGIDLPPRMSVPGWGEIPKSDIAWFKTLVETSGDRNAGEVSATVTHYFELELPYVNYLFQWLDELNAHSEIMEPDIYRWHAGAPHVPLRSTTTLAVP